MEKKPFVAPVLTSETTLTQFQVSGAPVPL